MEFEKTMLFKNTVKSVKHSHYSYLCGDKYYVQFKIKWYRNITLK